MEQAHFDSVASQASFRGYRFPKAIVAFAVWLYFRFPLSLRMVEEMLAARGIAVTYETVRRWANRFGRACARQLRAAKQARGDKWHLDEMVVKINGCQHWL